MNDYRFKRWLIIGSSVGGVGVLYWLIYFIRYISTSRVNTSWFEEISYVGYVFIGVGLVVILGDMLWALYAAKHPQDNEPQEKHEEKDSLNKYRSKK